MNWICTIQYYWSTSYFLHISWEIDYVQIISYIKCNLNIIITVIIYNKLSFELENKNYRWVFILTFVDAEKRIYVLNPLNNFTMPLFDFSL